MSGHPHIREHDPMRWAERANCFGVDPSLFFPERWDAVTAARAKAVCAGCTVSDECLAYAIEHSERFGIWGGIGEQERRRIRSRRNHARRTAS